jgi:uncharacterized protein YegP (UPF0339 family)
MKFYIKNTRNGQFRFVLKARNGEKIAQSETYVSKQACIDTVKSFITYANDAEIIDLTKK